MTAPMRSECGLLKDHWYAACLSTELGKKAPLERVVLGEPLALFRDAEGNARALANRCLHRGAPLSEGVLLPNHEGGCLACPYHGWTYDRMGLCVNVPSESAEGRPSRHLATERFLTSELDGIVWVWMGGDAPPHEQPFRFPYRDTPGWRGYWMCTEFDNGVTNLVENFMDVPHTVFVHKGWFRTRAKKPVRTRVERSDTDVLVTYHQPNDVIGFGRWILNPKGLPMTHTDHFTMPATTRVDYLFGEAERGFAITSTCTPEAPMKTRVYTRIEFKLGPWNTVGRAVLPPYTRKVIQQDVEILELQGRSLRQGGPQRFHSTAADAIHLAIESLREWESNGGRDPRPQPTNEEMEFWI